MSALSLHPVLRVAIVALLLLALLLGAQALAGAAAPAGGVTATGRVLGQTGFAFVGGLRTFVAAVLWNRLDPQFDTYYGGSFDKSFATFLPTIRLVLALDPQFEQAYYVTSFWLQQHGRSSEAIQLAEDGLRNNPDSGLMRANLAQVLLLEDKKKNLPRLLELANEGSGPDVTWMNADDRFEGMGIFEAVYAIAGDTEMVARMRREQDLLMSQGATAGVGMHP